MTNIAVIYAGKYGTTERYARWIAEETGGELMPESGVSVKALADKDVIIFAALSTQGRFWVSRR